MKQFEWIKKWSNSNEKNLGKANYAEKGSNLNYN